MSHQAIKIPKYHGLTNDETYLRVRKKHYHSFKVSDDCLDLLTMTSIKKFGFNLRYIIPLIAYEAYPFLSSSSEFESKWIDQLLNRKDWDLCSLSRLSSTEVQQIQSKVSSLNILSESIQKIWCFPYRSENSPKDFESYMESCSYKFRKNFRYTNNQLKKNQICYDTHVSFEEMLILYRKRHSIKGENDYSVESDFHVYLKELWNQLDVEKRTYTIGLRDSKSQELIAALMGFYWSKPNHENTLQVYQICYDPDYGYLNPGRNLLIACIQNHFESSVDLIDFMSEADYVGEITPYYLPYNRITFASNNWKMKALNGLRNLTK